MKIEIKSIYGTVLFEHECENNTLKKTLQLAIDMDANLVYADLVGADLREADLRRADLMGADLMGVNLMGADLREADFREADLREADLREADLMGADLREADLREADLMGADLMGVNLMGADLRGTDLTNAYNVPIFCKWIPGINGGKISIGCKTKSIKEWDDFMKSDQVYETERGTQEFKQIEAVILAYSAYLNHLNN